MSEHSEAALSILAAGLPCPTTPPDPESLHHQLVILGCWMLCLRLLGQPPPSSWDALATILEAHRDLLWGEDGGPHPPPLGVAVLPDLHAAPPPPAVLQAAWDTLPSADTAPEADLPGQLYEAWMASRGRRGRGSYYTPAPLVEAALQGALDPLLAVADLAALQSLRLVDPACGSGRFLVAAAQRLQARLEALAPALSEAERAAVVGAALHGVDLDPLAVGLCRVQLVRVGVARPVVVQQIRHGDALLGAPAGDAVQAAAWCRERLALDADAPIARPMLHWHLAFPAIMARGGFDGVLGNPPWIAHAGRAAQPLPPGMRTFLRTVYAGFSGYPTTHGAFVQRGADLLREGGRLGLVVPASMSELAGYRPARAAHDRRCAFVGELEDLGEGRFVGVTQPCMVLVSVCQAGGRTDAVAGAAWPVARPDLDATARALLARLGALPPLPAALFGERGIQSDARIRAAFCETAVPVGAFTVPVREGSDVQESRLLPPRIHVDPALLGGRLRPAAAYQQVALVVRQTAGFPVAACSDGVAFRNSLLAVFADAQWPAELLLVLLSAGVVRWLHHMRFRDARQPVLPQVKVGHLRQIPAPPGLTSALRDDLCALGADLARHNAGISPEARASLEQMVAAAYHLTGAEQALVAAWTGRMRPVVAEG